MAEHDAKQQKILDIHNQLKQSIFEKIPALNGQQDVYLPEVYFKKLTDEEFIVLWTLPGLVIKCSPNAGRYIENRRKELGLTRAKGSEVQGLKDVT